MADYIDLPKIHPVTHVEHLAHNKWCGPAAVSSLTGQPAEHVAEWLRLRRGGKGTTKGVRGTGAGEIISALVASGCRVFNVSTFGGNRTLTQWLRQRPKRTATYLVAAGHHWGVIRGNKYCCGKTQEVVSVREAPGRRARVTDAYRIQKLARFKFKDLHLPKIHEKIWDEKKMCWKLQ